jgi:hypothetical protein
MLEKVGLDEFIARHRDLEFTIQKGRENFISDWNGSHPFVEQFLGAKILKYVPKRAHFSKYIYYDEHPKILNGIAKDRWRLGIHAGSVTVAAKKRILSGLIGYSPNHGCDEYASVWHWQRKAAGDAREAA